MKVDLWSNSRKRQAVMILLAPALAAIMSVVPLQAKSKNNQPAEQVAGPQTTTFDISKIVWPSPPEIPRVEFKAMLMGQRIDWADLVNPPKPKQSWMDRLAGTEPNQQVTGVREKMGFQLMRPFGVAVDSEGNIYVADQAVGAIFIFPESIKGKVELIKNRVDAPLPMINGLAIDDDGRIFVTDVKLHHVLVLGKQHQPIAEFGAGDLVSPAGVAIDKENRLVYVVDTQQDQVLVFDADSYMLLRRIGTAGKKHTLTTAGNFALPTNVDVDGDGNVYVTDTLNDRVEIFDADGNFISQIGTPGDGPGHFARPKGIAIDRDGHIWVTDEVQSRVQVFDKQGRLLIYFGELGWYPGQFQALYGIASDDHNNRIITTEQFPGRVQVFRYVTDAEAAAMKAQRENQRQSHAKTSGQGTGRGAAGGTAMERKEPVNANLADRQGPAAP